MTLEIGKSYLWVEGCSVIRPIKDCGDYWEVAVDESKILTMGKEDTTFKVNTGRMTLTVLAKSLLPL